MAEDIRLAVEAGLRPCLFLDEIDKVAVTPFKLNRLAELIDAVWVAKGQIVATSNADLAQLRERWGLDMADTIVRRIGRGEDAHSILFG